MFGELVIGNNVTTNTTVHRDTLTGHLVWITLFLGTHGFGVFVHNDTIMVLGRVEDTLCDHSLQCKPTLRMFMQGSLQDLRLWLNRESKLMKTQQELGTVDSMIHHIHGFTIHCTLIICTKGTLFSRPSRLIAEKGSLGYRFPCDGPGRGGTCQISPWDHSYLTTFWLYNAFGSLFRRLENIVVVMVC